jgi:hypothetical protein
VGGRVRSLLVVFFQIIVTDHYALTVEENLVLASVLSELGDFVFDLTFVEAGERGKVGNRSADR